MNEAIHHPRSTRGPGSHDYELTRTRSGGIYPDRREVVATIRSWVAAIFAAAVGAELAEPTAYHQLAIAILIALVTLALVLGVLDVLWRVGAFLIRPRDRR